MTAGFIDTGVKFTADNIYTGGPVTTGIVDTDIKFTTGAITINVNLGKDVTTRHQCHLHHWCSFIFENTIIALRELSGALAKMINLKNLVTLSL
jgi:hypothetical protein